MTRTETSVVFAEAKTLIERPVADVFSFVTDPNNEPRWHTDIVEVRRGLEADTASTPESSYHQGGLWIWTARFMGRQAEGEVEVTVFEPNRRIEFTTRTGPVLPVATCLLEPADGGTIFIRRVEIPLQGGYRLAKPLIQRKAIKGQQRYVTNLKSILEHGEQMTWQP